MKIPSQTSFTSIGSQIVNNYNQIIVFIIHDNLRFAWWIDVDHTKEKIFVS